MIPRFETAHIPGRNPARRDATRKPQSFQGTILFACIYLLVSIRLQRLMFVQGKGDIDLERASVSEFLTEGLYAFGGPSVDGRCARCGAIG